MKKTFPALIRNLSAVLSAAVFTFSQVSGVQAANAFSPAKGQPLLNESFLQEQNPLTSVAAAGKNRSRGRIIRFTDAHGDRHKFRLDENASATLFDKSAFSGTGRNMKYRSPEYTYRLGVDVSKYQGKIDWKKVKKAGYRFAFIRIGYRGYGNGTMASDPYALRNLRGAQRAGIDTGVYFFSQAVNPREAREEARFVLSKLKGIKLSMPVAYDPESILYAKARTDKVKKKTFTANTTAFTSYIKKHGYKSCLYCNLKWEAYKLNMSRLKNVDIWYADYEKKPQTPYRFNIWQYTSRGRVPGIPGNADLNIQLMKK